MRDAFIGKDSRHKGLEAVKITKHIGPQVAAYAHALEKEADCKVIFKEMGTDTGVSARVHCSHNPRVATVYYDLKRQDGQNIQAMLAHEIGHAYLWFRDGFYLIYWNASIPPRTKVLAQNCSDLVIDVAVDRLIRGAGFHPWTPDIIQKMEEAINTRVRGGFYISSSWDAQYEILNRRLAREYMTISEEQIPIFDAYLQNCQSVFEKSIMDGVEKRFERIKQYNIFEPEGNKAAIEALLDVFGIRKHFWFCTPDEDPHLRAPNLQRNVP